MTSLLRLPAALVPVWLLFGVVTVAQAAPARLTFHDTTLPNGLRLVVHEDHSAPVANVQVWYHVGSKDEPKGRTGFAHLFEHLMFNGSKNAASGQHLAWLSAVGGQANAYTTEDVTVFWNAVPSSHVPLALWLESDRMASLRIERQGFERERAVLKEERLMRVENQPYGKLPELVYGQAFKVHPYGHPTIGALDDLEAATVEDVRNFYRTYYVPNNATVVVAGDVDAARIVELVTTYFGPVPRRGRPIPREMVPEPPFRTQPTFLGTEPWPLPVAVMAHHLPPDGHPDSFAVRLIVKILSDGESSWLHRALVYEQGLALTVESGGNLAEHPGLFYAMAVVQPGFTVEDALAALTNQLNRLVDGPVSEEDLARAKNLVRRDAALARLTVQSKAELLGRATVIRGDPAAADGDVERTLGVTVADVQRVAGTYLKPTARLSLVVLSDLKKKDEATAGRKEGRQ